MSLKTSSLFQQLSRFEIGWLVDLDPVWFLFPIHKVGVPSLPLYIKTNCKLKKLTGSKQIIKGCEKALAASEF